MKSSLKTLLILAGGAVLLFGLIQLAPVERSNPPVVTSVKWDSPQTQALFERACADCHSNQTVWPSYASIAPISWLVARDVTEGREQFNISDLGSMNSRRINRLPEEISEKIREGEMPMPIYLTMHPSANLSDAEKQSLIDGLAHTLTATLAAK
jgi:cytochrome c551/c552